MSGPCPPMSGPYKGLVPYGEGDHEYFFGRSRDRRVVAANLKSCSVSVLYGPSGVGKSSLLLAGVMHDLLESAKENRGERGRIGYLPVLFRTWQGDFDPGLSAALLERAGSLDLAAGIQAAGTFERTCSGWMKSGQGHILLILDQFEEFFLYHPSRDEQASFARTLASLAQDGMRLLFSLREDRLSLLEYLSQELPAIFSNQLRIEHLDQQDAVEAIEEPVRKWSEVNRSGHSIETGLAEEVIAQLGPESARAHVVGPAASAALPTRTTRIQAPWLQIVMSRLWSEDEKNKVLRIQTLRRLGGVNQIAERHLEDRMRGLSLAERVSASSLFLWLVTPSGTKVLYPEKDLIRYSRLRRLSPGVLKKLSGEGRILEAIDTQEGRRYQIYHDQLGPAILAWRARFWRRLAFNANLAVLGIALLAAAAAYLFYSFEKGRANSATVFGSALAAIETLQVPPSVRQNLALYAWGTAKDGIQKDRAAAELLTAFPAAVRQFGFARLTGVAMSPNTLQVALSGDGEKVWLMRRYVDSARRDIRSARRDIRYDVRLVGAGPVFSVALAAQFLATGGTDGQIRLYSMPKGELLREFAGHKGRINRLAITYNEDLLASAGADGAVKIWTTAAGKLTATLAEHTGEVIDVAFSARTPFLASTDSRGLVALWDRRRLSAKPLRLETDGVSPALAFDGTGRLLAVARPFHIAIHDLSCFGSGTCSPERSIALPAPCRARALSFSEAGSRLAAGLQNGQIRMWDTRSWGLVKAVPSRSLVTGLTFSSGGGRLVTVHEDGAYRLWDSGLNIVAELPLSMPVPERNQAHDRNVLVVCDLASGAIGSWLAESNTDLRMDLTGTPLGGWSVDPNGNVIPHPVAKDRQIPAIPPPGPLGPPRKVTVNGRTVSLHFREVEEALGAIAGSAPTLPRLTKTQCRELLGADGCPALPALDPAAR